MHILYLSQYFPPEAGATQTRAYEMARHFVRLGHAVTMIAEVPNHPSGIIHPEYRGKLFDRSRLEGIDIIRVWVKTSQIKNFRNRMLFYLTFMVNAVLAGIFLARARYDLIYATSPPLFVGGAAIALSLIKRLPFVFEIRDLWPESAVALGEIHSRRAITLASHLEAACYRRAKAIVTVSQGIYNRLVKRGIPQEKLVLIPNGSNVELFQHKPRLRSKLRKELGLEGKFVVIYAGILGIAQGLETAVEAARLLRDDETLHDPEVHLLIVGDGPRKTDLATLVERYRLSNLTMLPGQPMETIPGYLSAADVALVPLRGLDLFRGALPSKIFDAWACEIPILLGVDGEARKLLDFIRGGWYVPPEDPNALAEMILSIKRTPLEERKSLGKNGREYTVRHHSRQALAEVLIAFLEKQQ